MLTHYILDGHGLKPASLIEWTRWMEHADRRVCDTTIDDVMVSTVFIGLDLGIGEGPPIVFETMIFGGKFNEWQDRCATWDEAIKMHDRTVAMIRADSVIDATKRHE